MATAMAPLPGTAPDWPASAVAISSGRGSARFDDAIAFEQYRLRVVDGWPDDSLKRATLAAIRGRLTSLEGADPRPAGWTH